MSRDETVKQIRRRIAVEQALARGDWSDQRIADELAVTDTYVAQVREALDDLVWPTEGFALRKAGGRP